MSPKSVSSIVTPIVERATPKVNLTLKVRGRRLDGYHELDSLVAFALDVADIVTLSPGAVSSVSASGPFAPSIAGENLLDVTLRLIQEAAQHISPDLILGAVTLEKNMPIAAGIGGGSADAAALIRAVIKANPARTTAINWHAIANRIGADVPVCLASRAQHMAGIGERLTPLPTLPSLDAVLVNPRVAVPANKTALVFKALQAPAVSQASQPTTQAFETRAHLLAHIEATGNDLTAPALTVVPDMAQVLSALRASPSCELAQASGGGPTCFGIYPSADAAQQAAATLSRAYPTWWIAASRLG